MTLRGLVGLSLPAFLLIISGCGPSHSKVEGTVTLDGNPVEGALVILIKEGDSVGLNPTGISDSSGHFLVVSGNEEGVLPGSYKVTVSKVENFAGKMSEETMKDPTKAAMEFQKMTPKGEVPKSKMMGKGMMMPPTGGVGGGFIAPKPKHLLPEKFAAKETTTFSVTIPNKEPLNLSLTSDAPATKK